MASRRHARIIALGLLLVAAGAGGYLLWRSGPAAPIVGVVRTTEIRVAPEVGGQLAAIKVRKGARVRAGDVVAELSALELTASVAQARAALAAATGRPRPRLCRRARRGGRRACGRDRQGKIAAGLCGSAARPRRLPGAQRHRLAAGARPGRKRRRRPRAPTSPRRKPTMPPPKPGRPASSAPSRTRR